MLKVVKVVKRTNGLNNVTTVESFQGQCLVCGDAGCNQFWSE